MKPMTKVDRSALARLVDKYSATAVAAAAKRMGHPPKQPKTAGRRPIHDNDIQAWMSIEVRRRALAGGADAKVSSICRWTAKVLDAAGDGRGPKWTKLRGLYYQFKKRIEADAAMKARAEARVEEFIKEETLPLPLLYEWRESAQVAPPVNVPKVLRAVWRK